MPVFPGGTTAMTRLLLRCLLLCCLGLLSAAALAGGKGPTRALELAQYTWSAAIRWNDFEGAWNLVDPQVRAEHPLTDLDFSRYQQVQISSYRERGGVALNDGEVEREIEIGVINRNTQVERTVRFREHWRYDPQIKTWWQTSGLPDLWQEQ